MTEELLNQFKKKGEQRIPNYNGFSFGEVFLASTLILILLMTILSMSTNFPSITWQKFVEDILKKGDIFQIKVIGDHTVHILLMSGATYKLNVPSSEHFTKKLEKACAELDIDVDTINVSYHPKKKPVSILDIISNIIFFALLIAAFRAWKRFKPTLKGKGDSDISFTDLLTGSREVKSNINQTISTVRFSDVRGCDDAKNEIMEFVDFLKHPDKFQKMGARIPKGAILHGPPGTGKTLLAKAVAGEAGVPFFFASGSEFVEMFVGVGAKRVRELFNTARKHAPSIVFIDEIDTIGTARNSKMRSHSEMDQTINQLLCELDGFSSTTNVVVLCGTNQFESLDTALIRPGRLDRKIYLAPPDINGRIDLFKLYLNKLKIKKEDVDAYSIRLAGLTPGSTGADVASICNEGAIVAVKENSEYVYINQLEQAIDRLFLGNRLSKKLSEREKHIVSIHESGHTIVSWFLKHSLPILKVSIVPRGKALGVNQFLPSDDYLISKDQLLDMMASILGGRAAEEVILGSITTGAADDLQKVTQLAYRKVGMFGMDEDIGQVSYPSVENKFSPSISIFSSNATEYGNDLANRIDTKVKELIDSAYNRAKDTIITHKNELLRLSQKLYEKEVLTCNEVELIIGPRPEGAHTAHKYLDDNYPSTQPVATEKLPI